MEKTDFLPECPSVLPLISFHPSLPKSDPQSTIPISAPDMNMMPDFFNGKEKSS